MTRFVLLAGIVLCLGMLGTGFWVSRQVERIVTDNSGATTALYVDLMISPLVQSMDGGGRLTAEAAERLTLMIGQSALSRRVSAFKLWDPGGQIVFSSRAEQIGRRSPENPRLQVALNGLVHAELRQVTDSAQPGTHDLMEVYSPVRSNANGKIIAVAEFYTTTDALRADLRASRTQSWLVVAAVTLAMFVSLYAMFARGNRTIVQQRQALDAQIAELSDLLEQNRSLGQRVAQANHRIADRGEQTLRRISADLHDGPVQLMAFAAMRLDGVAGQERVTEAVNEALKDLRQICRGMVLPEVKDWTPATIARHLVASQESRMGGSISLQIADDLPALSLAQKICLYRFLQEALNNSARHATGSGQSVVIRRRADTLEVEVSDTGPGFDPTAPTAGLGLLGLRERIAGLDGGFKLHTMQGLGTCLTMRLPIAKEGA